MQGCECVCTCESGRECAWVFCVCTCACLRVTQMCEWMDMRLLVSERGLGWQVVPVLCSWAQVPGLRLCFPGCPLMDIFWVEVL